MAVNTSFFSTTFGLEGKKALITGAGRGIGAAISKALASAGAEVVLHYRSSKSDVELLAEEINKSGGKARIEQADLSDSSQVVALFKRVATYWESLDILINNAGDMVERRKIENFDDVLLDTVLKVNVHSAVWCTREALPLLKKSPKASVILMSSVAAHHGGGNGSVIYAAAKGALHTMVRGLAKELAPTIRVNGIAPGFILTDFHKKHTAPEGQEATIQATPLKRAGLAEDTGAAAVFLCAEGSSFITGETLEINGGLWFA